MKENPWTVVLLWWFVMQNIMFSQKMQCFPVWPRSSSLIINQQILQVWWRGGGRKHVRILRGHFTLWTASSSILNHGRCHKCLVKTAKWDYGLKFKKILPTWTFLNCLWYHSQKKVIVMGQNLTVRVTFNNNLEWTATFPSGALEYSANGVHIPLSFCAADTVQWTPLCRAKLLSEEQLYMLARWRVTFPLKQGGLNVSECLKAVLWGFLNSLSWSILCSREDGSL